MKTLIAIGVAALTMFGCATTEAEHSDDPIEEVAVDDQQSANINNTCKEGWFRWLCPSNDAFSCRTCMLLPPQQ